MTGTDDQLKRLEGRVALVAATADGRAPAEFPQITTQKVATSGAAEKSSRVVTAQIGQMLLFLLTMLLVPVSVWTALTGFALFRLFDIVKPWPIGWLDRHVHGGTGIMLDDLVAALYAGICIQALLWWW